MLFSCLILMALLVRSPYIRKGDDRLHLFVQVRTISLVGLF